MERLKYGNEIASLGAVDKISNSLNRETFKTDLGIDDVFPEDNPVSKINTAIELEIAKRQLPEIEEK